jgi:hypothetical protein
MNFALQTESNARGWTSEIFKHSNRESNLSDISFYALDKTIDFHDNYTGSAGDYTLSAAGSSPTFARDATVPNIGVWLLDCASSTDNQGGNLQWLSLPVAVSATNTLGFEVRLKVEDIATGPQFFSGVHAVDTAIISSGVMDGTASSYAGFMSLTDNNVVLPTSADNTAAETGATVDTLVDGTYVRYGVRIVRRERVEFYKNGVKVATHTTRIPAAAEIMYPSWVCQSAGTTDPIVHLDAFRIAVNN